MAKLFSKEKDIVLKVINSILVIWLIAAVVITFGVGIKIINNNEMLSYTDYSQQICDLDKIPAEEIDQDTIKDNCYASYISEKKDNESYNNANVNNILISLSNVVIVTLFLSLLNKKYK